MQVRKIAGNIYTVLILRMLLVYGIYMITRMLFYLYNLSLFENISPGAWLRIMEGGVRFDTSAIIYTNLLVIALHILPFRFRYTNGYQQVIKYIFYLVNGIAIIANMADSVYYRFTLRRTTTAVFEEFQNEQNGISLFFRFIWDYWYVTLSVVGLVAGMIWVYRKIRVAQPLIRNPWVYYSVNVAASALIVILCLGGMRGGFAHSTRPITLSNATEYIERPDHRAIVLNTPFALIRTIGKTTLHKKEYFPEEQISAIFNPVYDPVSPTDHLYGSLKGRNVVVILLESFAREYTGVFNRHFQGYQSYTPFLDSLAEGAYLFERAFANGRKSIDAMPSALASIPAMETCFILSHYSGNALNSPASLLAPLGYRTAFFHGAPNGSMGFNSFVKQAGYKEYYGKDEYDNNDDFDGIWGIWDEPFLSYMAGQLNEFEEPFSVAVFTLSSHHPYKVPEKYRGRFPMGYIPNHQVVGYTDYALRQFFRKASSMPWFRNTLFVITADHSAAHHEDAYKTALGDFAVPMVWYAPGSNLVGYNDSTVVSQCDILPTVMGLLGYDRKFVTYGRNMFDAGKEHFAVNFREGAFQITEGDYFLQYANEKVIAFYNYKDDPKLLNNLAGKGGEAEKKMLDKLRAVIQQYNAGMIDNKLAVEDGF